tara:strand:+ start:13326 stop:13766 length:441 start_codon:yes stop_codon:yes gene_type:complete
MTYKIKPWREQLEHIKELPEGWDDYGSPPLTDEQYNNAKTFLEKIEKLGVPDVQLVPCSGGGVQLEWCCNNKELEVDFTSDKVGYLKCDLELFDEDKFKKEEDGKVIIGGGDMEEGEFDITDRDEIFELMHWLIGKDEILPRDELE